MAKTLQKNIRITSEQWHRIETAATERDVTANQLLVELAMEALDHRGWPQTDLEIHMLRSCLFTAQAVAHDMIAAGRENEVEAIRPDVSRIAPELPGEPTKREPDRTVSTDPAEYSA